MLASAFRYRISTLPRTPLLATRRYIMSVPEFVAAAEKADASLQGEGKAQTEIQKLSGEVEALSKDIAVSIVICRCAARRTGVGRSMKAMKDAADLKGSRQAAHTPDLYRCEPTFKCRRWLVLPPAPYIGKLLLSVALHYALTVRSGLKPSSIARGRLCSKLRKKSRSTIVSPLVNVQLSAPATAHPTHPAVTRYFLHIQSLPSVRAAHSALPNSFPPVDIDVASLAVPERVVVDVKKEKKDKKDKAAAEGGAYAEGAGSAPAAGGRKAKKEAKAQAKGVVAQASEAAGAAVQAVQGAAVAAVGAVAQATGLASSTSEQSPGAQGEGAADAKAQAKKDKKEKKEKAPKPPQVKAEPAAPMPSMIDLRVGKVLDGEYPSQLWWSAKAKALEDPPDTFLRGDVLGAGCPTAELISQSRNTPKPTRSTSNPSTSESPSRVQSARAWSST